MFFYTKKLFVVFTKNFSNESNYDINGQGGPNYHLKCNGTPFLKPVYKALGQPS